MSGWQWIPIDDRPQPHNMVWLRATHLPVTAGWMSDNLKTFCADNSLAVIEPTEWAPVIPNEYPWGAFPSEAL